VQIVHESPLEAVMNHGHPVAGTKDTSLEAGRRSGQSGATEPSLADSTGVQVLDDDSHGGPMTREPSPGDRHRTAHQGWADTHDHVRSPPPRRRQTSSERGLKGNALQPGRARRDVVAESTHTNPLRVLDTTPLKAGRHPPFRVVGPRREDEDIMSATGETLREARRVRRDAGSLWRVVHADDQHVHET
jgi:hypothetical protein